MGNRTVVASIFKPCIVSNLSVASILFSSGNTHRYFNAFFPLYWRQSIRPLNFFLKWKIKPLLQQCFGLGLQAIYPLFQFLCHMENLTFFSTMFWLLLVNNLSLFSILLSKWKSNCCFNNVLAFNCEQLIPCFNSFL